MAKQTDAKNVIGRDKIIQHIWHRLEKTSIRFTAERRIGKTTIMTKMAAEPLPGKVVIYSDLEQVGSPMQFVEVILTSLSGHLSKTQVATNWLDRLSSKLGGTEIVGVIKLPQIKGQDWQPLLKDTLNAVCQNQTSQQLVFLWDEMPYMLQKIHESEITSGSNEKSALAILDILRALRAENPNLRMIFTGSVGLHHILNTLRDDRLAAQPVNNMPTIPIGPLSEEYAKQLAKNLLKTEEIECDNEELVIASLVTLTDRVPFYLNSVISQLALHEGKITVQEVEAQIGQHLIASYDPWEMEHFRSRLKTYYPNQLQDIDGKPLAEASIAKLLLNHLAMSNDAQSINECFAAIKAKQRIEQRDTVTTLLDSLAKDHYIVRNTDGKYHFLFPLLKRWWILAEGLNE